MVALSTFVACQKILSHLNSGSPESKDNNSAPPIVCPKQSSFSSSSSVNSFDPGQSSTTAASQKILSHLKSCSETQSSTTAASSTPTPTTSRGRSKKLEPGRDRKREITPPIIKAAKLARMKEQEDNLCAFETRVGAREIGVCAYSQCGRLSRRVCDNLTYYLVECSIGVISPCIPL